MITVAVISLGALGIFLSLYIFIICGILKELAGIRYSLTRLDNLSYEMWEKLKLGK